DLRQRLSVESFGHAPAGDRTSTRSNCSWTLRMSPVRAARPTRIRAMGGGALPCLGPRGSKAPSSACDCARAANGRPPYNERAPVARGETRARPRPARSRAATFHLEVEPLRRVVSNELLHRARELLRRAIELGVVRPAGHADG